MADETAATPKSKRWLWLLAVPLACCLSGGLVFGYARLTIDSNPTYVAALRRANANAAATARLGSPITVTDVRGFRLALSGDALTLGVSGPRGTGTLIAVAKGSDPDSLEIFNMALEVDGTFEVIRLDGATRAR